MQDNDGGLSQEFLTRVNFISNTNCDPVLIAENMEIQRQIASFTGHHELLNISEASKLPVDTYRKIHKIVECFSYQLINQGNYVGASLYKQILSLYERPNLFEQIYKIINNGTRFSSIGKLSDLLSKSDWVSPEELKKISSNLESASALSGDPLVAKIREFLGLYYFEDAGLLEKIAQAFKKNQEFVSRASAKERRQILSELVSPSSDDSTALGSEEMRLLYDDWQELFDQAMKLSGSATLRASEDRFSGQIYLESRLKIAFIRSMVCDIDGTPNLLEEKTASYLENGKITPDFVMKFFEIFPNQNLGFMSALAPLLEDAGLTPGYASHCIKTNCHPKRYKPLFEIFLNTPPEKIDSALMKYWVETDVGIFVSLLNKELFSEFYGEEIADKFLAALPKTTDERRNAFLHNGYDRTSEWITDIALGTKQHAYRLPESSESMAFSIETDIPIATSFIEKFGLAKNNLLFMIFKQLVLYEQGLIESLPSIVTEAGVNSLENLQQQVDAVLDKVMSTEPYIELGELTNFQISLITQVAGHDTHTHYSSKINIREIIDRFKSDLGDGELKEMNKAHRPLTLSVEKVKLNYEPSEEARVALRQFGQEISIALDDQPEKNLQFNNLKNQYTQILEEKVAALNSAINNEGVEEKKKQHITKQTTIFTQKLKSAPEISSPDELLANLAQLYPEKYFEERWTSMVRTLIIMKLVVNGLNIEVLGELAKLTDEKPTPETILAAANLINDFIKTHLLDFSMDGTTDYWDEKIASFLSEKGNKKFLKRISDSLQPIIGILASEIETFETTSGNDSQMQIECIPDRGFAGEMTGYIANACYTKEFPLLSKWPVTPYKFVDKIGNPPKLIGSALVFEVDLENGQKALMVRAINIPTESKYDIVTFIENFLDHIEAVGNQIDRKVVLVPTSEGSISNYRLTINHIISTYKDSPPGLLAETFSFNSVDLTNNCRVAIGKINSTLILAARPAPDPVF